MARWQLQDNSWQTCTCLHSFQGRERQFPEIVRVIRIAGMSMRRHFLMAACLRYVFATKINVGIFVKLPVCILAVLF